MGTVTAPQSPKNWKWINDDDDESWVKFSGINGLVINGGGKIDGQGAPWWAQGNRPTVSLLYVNNIVYHEEIKMIVI